MGHVLDQKPVLLYVLLWRRGADGVWRFGTDFASCDASGGGELLDLVGSRAGLCFGAVEGGFRVESLTTRYLHVLSRPCPRMNHPTESPVLSYW